MLFEKIAQPMSKKRTLLSLWQGQGGWKLDDKWI